MIYKYTECCLSKFSICKYAIYQPHQWFVSTTFQTWPRHCWLRCRPVWRCCHSYGRSSPGVVARRVRHAGRCHRQQMTSLWRSNTTKERPVSWFCVESSVIVLFLLRLGVEWRYLYISTILVGRQWTVSWILDCSTLWKGTKSLPRDNRCIVVCNQHLQRIYCSVTWRCPFRSIIADGVLSRRAAVLPPVGCCTRTVTYLRYWRAV